MKICFFNTNIAWGGGERWHFDMATNLSKINNDVTVVTYPKSMLHKELKNQPVSHYSVKLHNLSFLNPIKIVRLIILLKKIMPDILILNLPRDAKSAGLAAKISGVKHIIYRRGSAIPIKNKPINNFLFKHVITEIIANSEETKKTILANNPQLFDKNKIRVIYNGINIQPFEKVEKKKENGELVIGNLGRLVKQKGQKYLIQLAAILKEKNISFKIIIGGDGALEKELKALAQEQQVESYVEFPGFVNNIPEFMNKLDVFVLPSLWEGFGYVIIEAMAASLPVVAFNVSSNPELITDGESGFLVENNDVTELAEKILLLNNNSVLQKEMGERGRQIVMDKFTREKCLTSFESFLNELCPGC